MVNSLFSGGWLKQGDNPGQQPGFHTVQNIVNALTKAYLFSESKRFDIKCREYLKTQGKFYIADPGIRNYLLGSLEEDRERMLENVVYYELLKHRGKPFK